MNDRELVGGLPRDPTPQLPRYVPLRVAGLIVRVSFECGCTYDKVIRGQFEKVGHHLTLCFDHKDAAEVEVVALKAMQKAGINSP